MSSAPAFEAAGPSAHNTNGALQPDPAIDIPPSLGAFQSLLPLVDDLLRLVAAQAAGTEPADGVIIKARELNVALESMKNAALSLPGGSLSTVRLKEVEDVLAVEAERRRSTRRAFAATLTPAADGLGDAGDAGDESRLPSPNPKPDTQ